MYVDRRIYKVARHSLSVHFEFPRFVPSLSFFLFLCFFPPFALFAPSWFAFRPAFYFLTGFGSRFIFSSSGVTLDVTPSAGTSSFAVQNSALSTSRRKFWSPQFVWVWPPVKPTPRPLSGRSTAHIRSSSRPLSAVMCGKGPRGEEVLPCRSSSDGFAIRIGVTSFIPGRKRTL